MTAQKKNRKLFDLTTIITSVVCLLPILYALFIYADLPERVVIHWGADGIPDGWGPKWLAAFGLPIIFCVLNLVCQLVSNAEPRAEARPAVLMAFGRWIIAIISAVLAPVTLWYAQGREFNPLPFVCCFLGAMMVFVGNYLPKCRRNYTMGIKLPWTLSSDENWNRTHRLAGPIWMLTGVIFLVFGLFGWLIPTLVVLLIAMLIPTIYSYVLHRKGI